LGRCLLRGGFQQMAPNGAKPFQSDLLPLTAVWATQEEMTTALWILIRPGCILTMLAVGWAVNVHVFMRFRIDYCSVLGLGKDEEVAPKRLIIMALWVGLAIGACRNWAVRMEPSPALLWRVLLAYSLAAVALLGWLPPAVLRHMRWRAPLARALRRCFWPAVGKEVPFIEVLVADGLTSCAKVFFDLALGTCVALQSTVGAVEPVTLLSGGVAYQQMLQHDSSLPGEVHVVSQASSLGKALEHCALSPTPFLFWAMPFVVRAIQCFVTSQNASDSCNQSLQRVNLAKYLTALPVVFFSYLYARAGPMLPGLGAEDFEAMWAIAAIINAVFSFIWDMVMDWGLMQPAPCEGMRWSFGLRPVLLFRGVCGFYHISIVLNLLGRTLWSLRWSPQATELLGSFFLGSLQQSAEVLRRCLWNALRVEWEVIRKGIHRSDKHFPV